MNSREQQQIKELTVFERQRLGKDQSGHGSDHVQRVVDLARHILTTEPAADEFTVLAAALLHDTYDDKLFADQEAAKTVVQKKLQELQVPMAKQNAIFYIIDNMSWSQEYFGQAQPLDLNGQIVQDADRLDAIGAMGTARVIQYGVKKGHPLFDATMPPRDLKDKAAYRSDAGETVINHFYEKLFLIKDYLKTTEGQRIGMHRDQLMHDFVRAFEAEWQGLDYQE